MDVDAECAQQQLNSSVLVSRHAPKIDTYLPMMLIPLARPRSPHGPKHMFLHTYE